MAEELEAESKALEDEIKAEMEARDTAEITADIFKIRWTRVVSNRLDTQSVNNRFTRLLSVFMWASIPQKNPGTVPEKGLINKKVPIPGTRYISKRETGFEPAALALARRCSTSEPFAHESIYSIHHFSEYCNDFFINFIFIIGMNLWLS